MGVQLAYGTAGATGGGWSAQPGTLQPSFDDRTARLPVNDWQRRAPKSWKDRNQWVSLWPRGSFGMCGDDASTPYLPANADYCGAALFEPYSCDGEGTQTLKFIKGMAVDTSDAPLSGVNITAFRSSDEAHAGYVVQSRGDGSYDVPTNFPGVNHFVKGYLAGSPDRGATTLNTLQPTNIDGT